MKALLYKEGSSYLTDLPVPDPAPGEAVIAVEACGLCGTDIMKLNTRAASAVLGHELCGRVAKVGKDVDGLREGDRVACAHHVPCGDCHYCRHGNVSMCRQFKATNIFPGGFAEYVKLSALHVDNTALKVPDSLSAETASQMEPLACCLRNVKRLSVAEGDAVGIVGLGAIGQLTARLLHNVFGARVIGLDLDPKRAAALGSYGEGCSTAAQFEAAARSASSGRGLDALILSVGTPAFAAQALPWVRDGGTLNVFASFHPDPIMPLDLNAVYHRELTVVSSYSPALEDLREALDLIVAGRVDVSFPDQRVYGLNRFDEAVADVRARKVTKAYLAPLVEARR